jgi:hypothetical protein
MIFWDHDIMFQTFTGSPLYKVTPLVQPRLLSTSRVQGGKEVSDLQLKTNMLITNKVKRERRLMFFFISFRYNRLD